MFRDTSVTYPDDAMVLGRDLGPAIDIGAVMTRKVLKENGQVVYRSTVRPLTPDESTDETHKQRRAQYTEKVHVHLGDGFKFEDFANNPDLEAERMPDADDEVDVDTYDQYVGAAEVTLPIGDKMMSAKVKSRKRLSDENLARKAHSNPILDTRTREVEFIDGQRAELAANVIAQNIYAMCDSKGNQLLLMSGIIDHRKDESAIDWDDMYIQRGSNRRLRQTTKGWKDGSTSWERLADLKQSFPVEVADYAISNGIDGEAAFAWWEPYTIC